jgi:hypothetical protein
MRMKMMPGKASRKTLIREETNVSRMIVAIIIFFGAGCHYRRPKVEIILSAQFDQNIRPTEKISVKAEYKLTPR